ncbi:MAG: hypothetical protein DRP54_08270 [Spirochaetes bacterium]|nr:MAG: hypothetical protein DRP54_08270 [Spirochaetota bacterium]
MEEERKHHFEFPAESGSFIIKLNNGRLPDVSDDEVYKIGKIISDFLYGFFLEEQQTREHYKNIFLTILKDLSISIQDKDLQSLLRFAKKTFQSGDFESSLFISELVLARLNKIIDRKIENNDRFIDKEIIHLQISTLNFIAYLLSKLEKNTEYGLKLIRIAHNLLKGFDENSMETKEIKASLLDTEGALYIARGQWKKAIEALTKAHQEDLDLLTKGSIDAIGFRVTCSNLGYAMTNLCKEMLDKEGKINIHEIEHTLNKAKVYLMMVKVDKPPVVPENRLKDLELLFALKRMKKGMELCEEVRSKLQKRLI